MFIIVRKESQVQGANQFGGIEEGLIEEVTFSVTCDHRLRADKLNER